MARNFLLGEGEILSKGLINMSVPKKKKKKKTEIFWLFFDVSGFTGLIPMI